MKLIRSFILLLIVLISANAFGQNAKYSTHSYYHTRVVQTDFSDSPINKQSETFEQDVIDALVKRHNISDNPAVTFKLKSKKSSLIGDHYSFRQFYYGYPVHAGIIKANISKDGIIISSIDESFVISDLSPSDINSVYLKWNQHLEEQIRATYSVEVNISTQAYVMLTHAGNSIAVLKIQIEGIDEPISNQILLDKNLKVIHSRDELKYFTPSDTAVIVHVFKPNPLSSAGVPYGGNYVDNNDNSNAELSAEVFSDTVLGDWDGAKFELDNDAVNLKEVTTSNSGIFKYSRAHSSFEDVNAYFHVTRMHQHLAKLGYGSLLLANRRINIDTEFTTGDNSSYQYSTSSLFFGTGGVDDAEDAEVVVHEYGHAISYELNEDESPTTERESLDESVCDYLATSYSRPIESYAWEDVFNWDGHNEFWPGRIINSEETYDDYSTGRSIHTNGEFFSSATMEIWEEISRDTMDILLFEMLSSLSNTSGYPDAARFVLEADSVLFNKRHHCVIKHYYGLRKLVPLPDTPATVILPSDVYLCVGDSLQLDPKVVGSGNLKYSWIPGTELSDSTIINPIVTPTERRKYKFRVEGDTGCFAQETVWVNIGEHEAGIAEGSRRICFKDSVELEASGGNSFNWSPGIFMDDSTSATPIAIPPLSMVFDVEISIDGKCTYTDTVSVEVLSCGNRTTVVNSKGFSTNNGNLYIVLPEEQAEITVVVYDAIGRLLKKHVQYNTNAAVVEPQYFSAGAYLVRVYNESFDHSTKVVKLL